MEKKISDIEGRLRKFSSAVVAFSGGVDSSFLLAVAKKAGIKQLMAIMVECAFVPEKEKIFSRHMAEAIDVPLTSLFIDVFENQDILNNSKDRCYFCKKKIFSVIRESAYEQGVKNLLHAVNLDDLGDYRPGLKAADELGFVAPLAEAGFNKADIRRLSREMGLETWNKPSQSCLATRIPYGHVITREELVKIDNAENFLHECGFEQVRVRCHGNLARIEVPTDKIDALVEQTMRQKISKAFKLLGFTYASIDVDGYETGKMNHEIF